MNRNQKRDIIIEAAPTNRDGLRRWETYEAWLNNGSPTAWKLSQILGMDKTTVTRHLKAANAALDAHLQKVNATADTSDDETIGQHRRECEELSRMTYMEGSEAKTQEDGIVKRVLLRVG